MQITGEELEACIATIKKAIAKLNARAKYARDQKDEAFRSAAAGADRDAMDLHDAIGVLRGLND